MLAATWGHLSLSSGTPSPSLSRGQPSAVLAATWGHLSLSSGTPSPSLSAGAAVAWAQPITKLAPARTSKWLVNSSA